jgi:hypothetical protein
MRGLFGPKKWPTCGTFGESGLLRTAERSSLTRISRAVSIMHVDVQCSMVGPVRLRKQGSRPEPASRGSALSWLRCCSGQANR